MYASGPGIHKARSLLVHDRPDPKSTVHNWVAPRWPLQSLLPTVA